MREYSKAITATVYGNDSSWVDLCVKKKVAENVKKAISRYSPLALAMSNTCVYGYCLYMLLCMYLLSTCFNV